MRRARVFEAATALTFILTLILTLTSLAACVGASSSAGAQPTAMATRTPFPTPTATLDVPSHDVSFMTIDHIQLAGAQFGRGTTWVIFSNQTDTFAGNWRPVAQQFAARGYSALCYDYRGRGASQGIRDLGPSLLTDLRAAIAFAQRQGAQRIVLVGASIGGAVTALVASSTTVAAVALLSAPGDFPQLEVTATTMANITAPKLLMNSLGDSYAEQTRTMYAAARPPKALHLYPGADHGIDLLIGDYGADAMQRLLTFTQQYAPASA